MTCPFGAIAKGAQEVLSFVAAVDSSASATIENTAIVSGNETDPAADDNSATHLTLIAGPTDLYLIKDAAASVVAGTNLTYRLTVHNRGPRASSGGTVSDRLPAGHGPADSSGGTVSDILPAGLTFVSSASGCTELVPGRVTCPVGALANGADEVLSFVAAIDPSQVTPITNTATVSGNESDPASGNNAATHETTFDTDLALIKRADRAVVQPGSYYDYSLIVSNKGPNNSSGGIVRDILPARVYFQSVHRRVPLSLVGVFL